MSERVPAWAESDERYPEREAEWRAAIARAERAEAGLAALREAAADVRVAFYDLSVPHRVAVERHAVLDAALADTAAAADAYRASVEAPLRAEIERITARHDRRLAVIDDVRVALASPDGEDIRVAARRVVAERDAYAALDCSVQHDEDRAALGVASLRAERAEVERDTLAAALAEVREAARVVTAHARYSEVTYASCVELDRALTALPADLAADAFRRARAEALEAAADAIERGSVLSQYGAHGWLRARAADERGGR